MRLRRTRLFSPVTRMPVCRLLSRRLSSTRWPAPPSRRMPCRNPRMSQRRMVAFCRSEAWMPSACDPLPAARPPSLKWLQSMVTLFAAMVIALLPPEPMLVARFPRRHHTPWVVMTAGSESMKPEQLSKDSAAVAGRGAGSRKADRARLARSTVRKLVMVGAIAFGSTTRYVLDARRLPARTRAWPSCRAMGIACCPAVGARAVPWRASRHARAGQRTDAMRAARRPPAVAAMSIGRGCPGSAGDGTCRLQRGLGQVRPALEQRGADAGGIQACLGQQVLAAGVVLEGVGQAQVQNRQGDAFGREQFGHAAARAA